MIGHCRLCLQIKNLRQSHIIPEFIYKPLYSSKHLLRTITDAKKGLEPRLIQKGYREELLCQDCESYLNINFEHPSVEIWKTLTSQASSNTINVREVRDKQQNRALIINGFDYPTFKLFLLSIIWRVSISTQHGFQHINLGPHEEKIRQMLLNLDPGSQSDYPCIINLLTESSFTPIYITKNNPRYEGHRIFRMILTNVIIWYVISSHSNETDISGLAIKENGSLIATLFPPGKMAMLREVADILQTADIHHYILK